MGVTICHLINSLHNASMYGRLDQSSNVGKRSLPITASSSACARLCTCGKRARARKREVIEDTVSIVGLVRKLQNFGEICTVSKPADKTSRKSHELDS